MNTPENHEEFWEKELSDLQANFSGFETQGSLMDSVYDETNGTPEQQQVFQTIRDILKPFEDYMHAQAGAFSTSVGRPGIRKSPFGHKYNFKLLTKKNNVIECQLEARRIKDKWLAKSLNVKDLVGTKAKIKHPLSVTTKFNTAGQIIGFHLEDLQTSLKSVLNVERPDKMGVSFNPPLSSPQLHPVSKNGDFISPYGSFTELVSTFANNWIPIPRKAE